MIGSSGNISPGNYHTHEHEITKCMHETKIAKLESGGRMAAGNKMAMQTSTQQKKSFSLKELLANGLQGLLTKATAFWGKLGEEGQEESGEGRRDKGLPAPIKRENGIQGTVSSLAEAGAAGVVSTVMVKPESRMEEIPEEKGRRVGNIEGAVSGGLKRGQGGIRKFLEKFGETAAKAGQFFKRKKQIKTSIPEEKADFTVDNNSFLLDSYNKMGEYSTLAQDRSLEGNFRAKG